jgi:SAM-dependent methyltransferase
MKAGRGSKTGTPGGLGINMQKWSHGYNTSRGYTYGFHRLMAPLNLEFCALNAKISLARDNPAVKPRYLELGCGQGFGLCVLAAANPDIDFIGIDFSPEHIAHASALARSGSLENVRFIEGDFTTLATEWPAELAECDYIVAHGIYTWISQPIRESLVRCMDHASRPGTLVYLSYNSMPGQIGMMPIRHLAKRLNDQPGADAQETFEALLKIFNELNDTRSLMTKELPHATTKVSELNKRDPAYLVHEYLNDAWVAHWFSSVAADLDRANLKYLTSARIEETLLPDILPKTHRDLIIEQDDHILRQEALDCLINRQFRVDLFWQPSDEYRRVEPSAVLSREIMLVETIPDSPLRIPTSYSVFELEREKFKPITDALADGALSIEGVIETAGMPARAALSVIYLLLGAGKLAIKRPVTGT